MSEQGRWFKLWTTSLDDPHLDNLALEDWARWAKLGTYIKVHGTAGEIGISAPSRALVSHLQCVTFDVMISRIMLLPNITVTVVTNATVTHTIKWENWLKYQGDYSNDRVKKFRAKKRENVTPKKRREEKRQEEKITTPLPPTKGDVFEAFWTAYPKKVGKEAARKAWKIKANGSEVEIMRALAWQCVSDQWTKDGGQFVPNPATYLNQGRWKDEPPAGESHPLPQPKPTKEFYESIKGIC